MIRKLRRIFGDIFEQDYHKIKPIFDIIIPQLKKDGWQGKGAINEPYHRMTNKELNASELENQICDHYFEYTKELYEKNSPELVQIHKLWYAAIRDFIQSDYSSNKEKTTKRLQQDFKKYFD